MRQPGRRRSRSSSPAPRDRASRASPRALAVDESSAARSGRGARSRAGRRAAAPHSGIAGAIWMSRRCSGAAPYQIGARPVGSSIVQRVAQPVAPRAQRHQVLRRSDRAEQPGRQRAVEPQAGDQLRRNASASAPSSVAPASIARANRSRSRGNVWTRTSPRFSRSRSGGLGLVVRVVVVAHRQQHAHRTLQRALEEAAQIGDRERRRSGGGARRSSRPGRQCPSGGRDRVPGGRAASAARSAPASGSWMTPAALPQRSPERDGLPLARGGRDHRADGVVLVARQRRVLRVIRATSSSPAGPDAEHVAQREQRRRRILALAGHRVARRRRKAGAARAPTAASRGTGTRPARAA